MNVGTARVPDSGLCVTMPGEPLCSSLIRQGPVPPQREVGTAGVSGCLHDQLEF